MSEHPEIRIGDRERLHVQDRLRDAYGQGALNTEELEERLELALRARTQSDLVPLVADLPAPVGEVEVEVTRESSPAVAVPGEEVRPAGGGIPWGWLIIAFVLLGGVGASQQLLGGLTDIDAVTVFGSRQLTLDPSDTDISVLTIFGSTEVIVPDDVRAANNTTPIFGSSECASACTTTDGAEQTTVTVTGMTLFGSVEYVRLP